MATAFRSGRSGTLRSWSSDWATTRIMGSLRISISCSRLDATPAAGVPASGRIGILGGGRRAASMSASRSRTAAMRKSFRQANRPVPWPGTACRGPMVGDPDPATGLEPSRPLATGRSRAGHWGPRTSLRRAAPGTHCLYRSESASARGQSTVGRRWRGSIGTPACEPSPPSPVETTCGRFRCGLFGGRGPRASGRRAAPSPAGAD
jgi:hypothetical protein